jgi:ABC-type enterochelin transport system substrate-binding protein
MKKILFGLFSLLFAFSFWNCEKDDICEEGTPTTPRMIVEFYDNAVPTNPKTVTDLKVTAAGQTTSLEFNAVSKVQLPLKVNENSVNYELLLNSKNANTTLQNADLITINYTRNDVFISRACGNKTVFNLNENPNGVALTADTNNWIKEINIQEFVIENENEIHVKIFF